MRTIGSHLPSLRSLSVLVGAAVASTSLAMFVLYDAHGARMAPGATAYASIVGSR